MNSVSNSDSEQCTESKTGLGAPGAHPEPRLRAHGACTVPRPVCLLSLLCACSGCCVPAQPSMCHNTAEPTVCLLSLLCATYSRAYCVLAQAAVCQLSLSRYNRLYRDTLLQHPTPALLSQYNLLYCDTISQPCQPSACHNTTECIATRSSSPSLSCHNTLGVLRHKHPAT